MGKESQVFYKVSPALVREIGTGAAFLYALLENASKVWNKDAWGYFALRTEYIIDKTGWSKRTIVKRRDKLVAVGLLRVRGGVNRNKPTRYKLA
jgi:replication initiation and membrane attachment protein DnaB